MVIPLKVLRRPSGSVQTWRFDFIRRIAALNVNESWAYDATMNDGGGGISGFPQAGDARFWPQLTDLKIAGAPARRPPARGNLRARQRGRGPAAVPAGRRQLRADRRAPRGRGHRRAGHRHRRVRRRVRARLLERRGRPADDRAARVPPRARPSTGRSSRKARTFSIRSRSPASTRRANVIFYSPAIGPFDRGLKFEGTQGLQSFGALEAQGAGFDDMVFGYKHATPNRAFAWSLDGVMTHHQLGNDTIDQRAGNDTTWQAQVGGRNNNTGFVYAFDYAHEHGTFVSDDRLAYKSEDFIDVHQHNYEVFTGYRTIGPRVRAGAGLHAEQRHPRAADVLRPQRHAGAARLDQARRPVHHRRPVHRRQRRGAPGRHQRQPRPAVQERAAPFGRAVQLVPAHLRQRPGRLSVLHRRRDALVRVPQRQPRLERRHARAAQRELLVGAVRRHVPAAGDAVALARDRHALEHRRRGRRHARAPDVRRRRPTGSGCAASRSARTLDPSTNFSIVAARRSAEPAASRSPASTSPARSTTASRTTASCSSTTARPRRRRRCSAPC